MEEVKFELSVEEWGGVKITLLEAGVAGGQAEKQKEQEAYGQDF